MKESEESPAYEAREHSKKFLKEAEMAKEHMGGKHHDGKDGHDGHDGKKHGKKMPHHKSGGRKHHSK